MKNIFIMAHAMELGGAERALLGILESMDYKKYNVDLFLLHHSGELMDSIPKEVNLLPEIPAYSAMGIPIKKALRNNQFKVVAARIYAKIRAKKVLKKLNNIGDTNIINEYSHKYTVHVLPGISQKEYDAAISFVSPHYIVSNKIKAKRKIAWIHTDYKTLITDVDSEKKMWSRYDRIISISPDVTKSFVDTFPELESKIVMIENIFPINHLISLRQAIDVEKELGKVDCIKLLTIGRFVPQKNFVEIPEICKRIRMKGIDVRWYIIGFGMEESLIRTKIHQCKMEDHVIMLGKKSNPYPYIDFCDVYVQPSKYEGKSIAVREAQIMNKPVIITDYLTAKSQVKDKYDGIIVPMDVDKCAQAISECIMNQALLSELSENTKQEDYVLKKEIDKVYRLFE